MIASRNRIAVGTLHALLIALCALPVLAQSIDTQTVNVVVGSGATIGLTTGSGGAPDTYDFSTRSLDMNDGTQRHFTSNNDGDSLILTNLNQIIQGGNIDASETSGAGGNIGVYASGNVALSNILTYAGGNYTPGGNVTLEASGSVNLSGYVKSCANYSARGGVVTISGTSISIGDDGTYSILTGGNRSQHGAVSLYSTGAVTLADAIDTHSANALTGGVVTIQGNIADTVYAGSVSVGGDIDTWGNARGVNVTIKSRGTVTVSGNIETYSEGSYVQSGDVFVFGSNDVSIAGYIDTRLAGNGASSYYGGEVVITGATVTISGVNGSSISVDSRGVGTGSRGGNIVLTATEGDVIVTGGFDATGNGAEPDGSLTVTADDAITMGSLTMTKVASAAFDSPYTVITNLYLVAISGTTNVTAALDAAAGQNIYYGTDTSTASDSSLLVNGGQGGTGVYYLVTGDLLLPEPAEGGGGGGAAQPSGPVFYFD